MLPLEGVRILDLGTVLMAPYAAQWLADLGANVIKVEAPAGDTTRRVGPRNSPDMASVFLSTNRNKRSVVLDLKAKPGYSALLALADASDVLLHNNRPQKMKALGLGPDVLRARNPRLIYVSFTGFGEAGARGGEPAYEDIIQGLCGLADLAGQRSEAPAYLPTAIADKTAGLMGALTIAAALLKQQRVGAGSHIEVPMFESMVAYTAVEHLYGRHFDPPLGPAAYSRIMTAERRPFATADGYLCVMPYTDAHWRDLFLAVDRHDLAQDPRFAGISARTDNIAALYESLGDILKTQNTPYWLEVLARLQIPNAPVKSLDELIDDDHLAAVGFFQTLKAANGDALRMPGVPILIDGQRPPVRYPPELGEHTREILLEAGLSAHAIEAVLAGTSDADEP